MKPHTLKREVFETARSMEFCTEKELTNQIGHAPAEWPLVILKESVDNALDSCEEGGIAPIISVKVNASGISITDNGLGMPSSTIKSISDFSHRVSSREAYLAPDRGAQGNALQTVVAMPFALGDGDLPGRVDITNSEGCHQIVFRMDPIRQKPKVEITLDSDQNVKTGTIITVLWPHFASNMLSSSKDKFLQLAADFSFLNPHLTLSVDWFGNKYHYDATNPNWRKWKPNYPTSPYWYSIQEFERLIAACIAFDQDRNVDRYVRDFVKDFKGLSGTKKQKEVLDLTGMGRVKLSSMANGDGLDHVAVANLLKSMRSASKEVKPSALGIIGRDHLRQVFMAHGSDIKTFSYKKIIELDDGVPFVIESAFALLKDETKPRRIITGINWSAALSAPFRTLGASYSDSLDALLEKQLAGNSEPIMLLLHLACPRVRFTDRGKSAITMN